MSKKVTKKVVKKVVNQEEVKEEKKAKLAATKDFSRRSGGKFIFKIKKGDECSKYSKEQKAELKKHGVI